MGENDPGPAEPGRYVRLSIRDQGIGVPREHLSKIFDPYFTTKREGSGLGLASVYSIVRKHGGRITVESEPGRGAVFHVLLLASGEKVREAVETRTESRIAGSHILVMDDEEMVRNVAVAMLRRLGCEATTARDGAEALELYEVARESGRAFDLVIMDLTVPGGMGGREAIEKLRKLDPDVPAVVSSGYSNDPVLANHEDHGFRGVVVKPYTIDDLGAAIARATSG